MECKFCKSEKVVKAGILYAGGSSAGCARTAAAFSPIDFHLTCTPGFFSKLALHPWLQK